MDQNSVWFREQFKPEGVYFLGKSELSLLYGVVSKKDGAYRAVKIIQAQDHEGFQAILVEIKALMELDHINILKIESYVENPADRELVIIMGMGENALNNYILEQPGKCIPKDQCLALSQDLLSALEYAHSKMITHQDVRAENVIFFDEVAKLTGWGSAIFLNEKEAPSLKFKQAVTATKGFTCPEFESIYASLRPQDYFDYYKKDIYSFGMLIFNMCGVPKENLEKIPKDSKKDHDAKIEDLINEYNLIENYSIEFIEFVKKLIEFDPNVRLYASKAKVILVKI